MCAIFRGHFTHSAILLRFNMVIGDCRWDAYLLRVLLDSSLADCHSATGWMKIDFVHIPHIHFPIKLKQFDVLYNGIACYRHPHTPPPPYWRYGISICVWRLSLLLVEFQSIWHIYGEYIFTDLSIHFSTVFARDWAKLYLILSFFLRFPCSPVPFVFRNQMASHTANRTQRKRKRERESEILTRMTEWNTKKGMQFIFFIFHFGSATKESKSYTHTQCVRELPTTFVNFAILTSNT